MDCGLKKFLLCAFFFVSSMLTVRNFFFFLAYFLVTSEPTCQFQLIYFTCMNLIAFKEGYPGYPPYLLAFFSFFFFFCFDHFDFSFIAFTKDMWQTVLDILFSFLNSFHANPKCLSLLSANS